MIIILLLILVIFLLLGSYFFENLFVFGNYVFVGGFCGVFCGIFLVGVSGVWFCWYGFGFLELCILSIFSYFCGYF